MKNLVLMMILAVFTLSGCATIDYFNQPETKKALIEAGVTCFNGQNYTLGIEYGLTRDGKEITNATQVGGIIGCDNKKFTVICDVTKGPDENPCSNVRVYTEDTTPEPTPKPVVPEVVPDPVPEVKPELEVAAEMWCSPRHG